MIEDCLALNNKFELYIDQEMYKAQKWKISKARGIEFTEINPQIDLLVPNQKFQDNKATLLQKLARGFLTRKNLSSTKVEKQLVYSACIHISGSLGMLKLIKMG